MNTKLTRMMILVDEEILEWLQDQPRSFKFSPFVREQIHEYIKNHTREVSAS